MNHKGEITLEQRLERGLELRRQGYNCSQCVALAYVDLCGVDADALGALSIGLGGGVGGTHHICGTVAAMALVVGAVRNAKPQDKAAVYADIRTLVAETEQANGSVICSELLKRGADKPPCNDLILQAITRLYPLCSK